MFAIEPIQEVNNGVGIWGSGQQRMQARLQLRRQILKESRENFRRARGVAEFDFAQQGVHKRGQTAMSTTWIISLVRTQPGCTTEA